MSNAKRKVNKKITVAEILKAAEGNIKDIKKFNELMNNDEDIEDAASAWGVEVTYL